MSDTTIPQSHQPQTDNQPTTNQPPTDQTTNQTIDPQTLIQELEDTKTKLNELTGISQRALADLQNYKRRVEEERSQLIQFANSSLLTELLPHLDNLQRAIQYQPQFDSKPENQPIKDWISGLISSIDSLNKTLNEQGLNPISTDQPFNPNLHEAILSQPGEQDKILQTLENGYTYNNKTIRRAKVIVGNGTPIPAQPTDSQTQKNPT